MQKKYQLELKKIKKMRASMRRKSSVETELESSDTETNNNNPMQNEEQSSEQEN